MRNRLRWVIICIFLILIALPLSAATVYRTWEYDYVGTPSFCTTINGAACPPPPVNVAAQVTAYNSAPNVVSFYVEIINRGVAGAYQEAANPNSFAFVVNPNANFSIASAALVDSNVYLRTFYDSGKNAKNPAPASCLPGAGSGGGTALITTGGFTYCNQGKGSVPSPIALTADSVWAFSANTGTNTLSLNGPSDGYWGAGANSEKNMIMPLPNSGSEGFNLSGSQWDAAGFNSFYRTMSNNFQGIGTTNPSWQIDINNVTNAELVISTISLGNGSWTFGSSSDYGQPTDNPQFIAPEPATMGLMGVAITLGGIAVAIRRRKQQAKI